MFEVTLIGLDRGARTVQREATRIELHGLTPHDLRVLLGNFSAIDPLETANSDAEVRVRANAGAWIVRAGPRKLILYDALNREAPGLVLEADAVVAEIDGSAHLARAERALTAIPFEPRAAAAPVDMAPPAGRRRVGILLAVVVVLATAIAGLRLLRPTRDWPGDFQALGAAEAAEVRARLAGVYLTGTLPGHHGLVLGPTEEIRLFEFRAAEAPRRVQATAVPGRSAGQLCLATDQPGGIITVRNDNVLIYGDQVFTRLP